MMKHLTTVLFLVAALVAPAIGAPAVFNGDVVTSTMPTANVKAYGAKADNGTTDNTTAFNNAIAAVANAGGGTVLVPCPTTAGSRYVILGALTVPYTGPSTKPVQNPVRITSPCGPAWNSYLSGDITASGAVLDLQYTGGDGLHPAKIDTRGGGYLEIDHLTLEDTGGDNFPFGQTTNTALYVHDNAIIGNTANSGTSVTQDAWRLGGSGYWSSNVTTTNGSTTLTCSDCAFTAGMVGWTINYSPAGNIDVGSNPEYSATISAVNSSTSITLSAAATANITGGEANYYGIGTDPKAPFQGYTSKFEHNLYTHIRRSAILGNFANGNVFEDELFSFSDGCNNATIPNCAPYYFDKVSSSRIGNIIRAPQGEVTNYPYFVTVANDANGNAFENLSPDDATVNNVGGVYFGGAAATNNTVTIGSWIPYQTNGAINTTIATGFSAGTQTVTPASMTGITTSTTILIDPDGSGVAEWVTPSSTTGTTFTATFANAHGNNIRVLGFTPMVSGGSYTQNVLVSNGLDGNGTVIPNAVTLGGSFPNSVKTTVNAPIVYPNTWNAQGLGLSQISDGGTVSSTIQGNSAIAFGSVGSLPAKNLFCWGSTTSGSAYSCFAPTTAGIAGVTGNMFALANNGSTTFTIDSTGQLGAASNIQTAAALVSYGTGTNLILGNGAGGTASVMKLSNTSGAASQYTQIGSGTSNFGATCATIVPSVFAVGGVGGTCTLATDQAGDVGIPGVLALSSAKNKGDISCSLSASTSCSATVTVNATSTVCMATYNHLSSVSLTSLLPVNEVVTAGPTLTVYVNTSSAQTGTVDVDYLCF